MTPAAHWAPDDYYRASRQARAAWESSEPQLTLILDPDYATDAALMPWPGVPRENLGGWPDDGLGETDGPGTTSLVGSSVSPNPPSPNRVPSIADRTRPLLRDGEGGFDTPPTRETP